MRLTRTDDGFTLELEGRLIARHSTARPMVEVGRGAGRMEMYRGNFAISDQLEQRTRLPVVEIDGRCLIFRADPWAAPAITLEIQDRTLVVIATAPGLNRFWFHLHAEPDEAVWGCGEQMSYLDLRGRRFPLWTSEPGVGRDKGSEITRRADREGHAGGDYYTTNYPQPTYLTSRRLGVHVETTAYAVFDFSGTDAFELEIWAAPLRLEFYVAPDFLGLVRQFSDRFGRAPRLADWIMQGAVIGLKDGSLSYSRLETIIAAGVKVAALWCEDWAGVRQTSFGTRLFWDWTWNASRHPDLPHRIAELAARGIRFMGYANPYLCVDGTLFPQADSLGYLARTSTGETYRVDFGEFEAGIVDFTNPQARTWFAESVLHREMLELGMAGWMADFGEYLPIDAVLSKGDALMLHNAWPAIWAGVNAQAVADDPDAVFFMRAGYTGVQRHNRLLWAGDQCVDFSRHDGLGTTICAALSAGLLGNPYSHSDIGGYTSLFGLTRTAELFMRWAELAVFTPVMRTHEGNRPRDNLQLDQSEALLAHFARCTRLHAALFPLFSRLADEAASEGLPMQRPLFLHFPEDRATYGEQSVFLLGPDLLVAPVLEAGASTRALRLPLGADWVHVWSGARHAGGTAVEVAAPLGSPGLFYRAGCDDEAMFRALALV